MIIAMKTINHAFTGLVSSLLLNVGLTSAAEKFDTMRRDRVVNGTKSDVSAESCIWVCDFAVESCIWVCDFAVESGK